MTALTHETAPTLFVQAGDTRLAYRRFGRKGDVPLLLLNYLAANMDDWDPTVTNGLAAEHDVILFDYPGSGGSSGETPSTVAALARACVALCQALEITRFDVMGFSIGGMIAQQLGFEYASMVRRILLLGTAPRGGEGLTFTDLSADERDNVEGLVLNALFSPSETSQAAGRAFLERLKRRVADRDKPVSKNSTSAEIAALREWGVVPSTNRFAMLQQIRQTTLIVHGSKDVVVMPINAFLLAEHLPSAQLIMYPDASHAAFSQYAENFLENARMFLNG
jgi:pimeloyl-ACP methyl ester carboxylesterase